MGFITGGCGRNHRVVDVDVWGAVSMVVVVVVGSMVVVVG